MCIRDRYIGGGAENLGEADSENRGRSFFVAATSKTEGVANKGMQAKEKEKDGKGNDSGGKDNDSSGKASSENSKANKDLSTG